MAAAQFTLISQHGADRAVRQMGFASYDDAVAYARANTPDTDGSMVPTIDEKFLDDPRYEKGFYWLGNRYAVLINEAS